MPRNPPKPTAREIFFFILAIISLILKGISFISLILYQAIDNLLEINNANRASNPPQLRPKFPPSTSSQPRRNDFSQPINTTNEAIPKRETTVECIICMEFNDQDDIVVPECGHVFHKSCVTPWIRSNEDCPICRKPATIASLRKVFVTVSSNENASASTIASTATIPRNSANNNMNGHTTNAKGTTIPHMFGRSIRLISTEREITHAELTTYIAEKFHLFAPHNFLVKRLKTKRHLSYKVSVDTEDTFNTLKNSEWPEIFKVREFIAHH